MVMLAHVQFTNKTGGAATVYYKRPGQCSGATQDIPANATSAAIEGILLTIDFHRGDEHYSVDFSQYLPKGLSVKDESPYQLKSVAHEGRIALDVTDNRNRVVDTFETATV